MIIASLKNFRQSPRKVRSVANLVRGKSVLQALNTLNFLSKKATNPLYGLLQSAIANAKNIHNIPKENLLIKELRVDTGVTLKRRMPRACGMAYPINKRSSNVFISLVPIAEGDKKFLKDKNRKK